MFQKVLIANRGEIAVRIIRACKEMGIATVAVFSEADRDALHTNLADESYCIGPAQASASYLNMRAILSVAEACGAEAIHPGYGLLSENAHFAGLCRQCGIVFIGPPPEVILAMGDKEQAKKTMRDAGVPVIEGAQDIQNLQQAKKAAAGVGFPLLVKARAGGGGRGIRLVTAPEGLESAYLSATEEARAAFGDGGIYLERFLSPVRHVEMQIIADAFENVVCLGERECSIQRRNQKLIEESPSPALSDVLRERMMQAAIAAAKATGYIGVGTLEFLLDASGGFYFMEMNTRLQVEHTVTEMVTGIDLVKWQIRVAAGYALDFSQGDIAPKGCAIECRINAENPSNGFRPSCGRITLLHIPGGPWVRFDTALYQDYCVPPFYDSMIGKLIVHAKTREEAIRKMQAALCELVIEGIDHNAELHMELLATDAFESGEYATDFIPKWECSLGFA